MREELTNKISEEILNAKDARWEEIFKKTNEYSGLLEDNIRNFYELQMEGGGCPLFALCYIIKEGKDNFGYSQEEYLEVLSDLEEDIEKRFSIRIRETGYDL